jgi:hypothetical protein
LDLKQWDFVVLFYHIFCKNQQFGFSVCILHKGGSAMAVFNWQFLTKMLKNEK